MDQFGSVGTGKGVAVCVVGVQPGEILVITDRTDDWDDASGLNTKTVNHQKFLV